MSTLNAASRSQNAYEVNVTGWRNYSVLEMKNECGRKKPDSPVLTQCGLGPFPLARCTLRATIYPEYNDILVFFFQAD